MVKKEWYRCTSSPTKIQALCRSVRAVAISRARMNLAEVRAESTSAGEAPPTAGREKKSRSPTATTSMPPAAMNGPNAVRSLPASAEDSTLDTPAGGAIGDGTGGSISSCLVE
jgi:hypothetical protein